MRRRFFTATVHQKRRRGIKARDLPMWSILPKKKNRKKERSGRQNTHAREYRVSLKRQQGLWSVVGGPASQWEARPLTVHVNSAWIWLERAARRVQRGEREGPTQLLHHHNVLFLSLLRCLKSCDDVVANARHNVYIYYNCSCGSTKSECETGVKC